MLHWTSDRRLALSAAALAVVLSARAARAQGFSMSDITNWTGSGSNEAALVVDWNNGTTNESLAWGYRWNGTATGEQMIEAIAANSSNLYFLLSSPSLGTESGYGTAVFGIGYSTSGSLAVSPPLAFNGNHVAYADSYSNVDDGTDGNPVRGPVNAGDQWEEGWYKGFWEYDTTTGLTLTDSTTWNFSQVGPSGQTLTNGEWDGWTYQPDEISGDDATPDVPEEAPAAAPEPTSLVLLTLGGTGLLARRRRWRR